jgi:hypothetical protein
MSPLGMPAIIGRTVLAMGMMLRDEREAAVLMRLSRGNRTTQRTPPPSVEYFIPQIPRELTWDRI